ncbi:MAG TPA: hypothetical protein VFZ52_24845 [Chryseolinea sp.]
MDNYLFKSREFALSDRGVHLMRSGFNYETIRWAEINSIKFKKAKELQNWWIILLLGAGLIWLGAYLTYRTFDIFLHKEHPERYAKMLLFLLIPWIGGYFVYTSFKTGPVMSINYGGNKREVFPLAEIIKQNNWHEFALLVSTKLGARATTKTTP